MADKRPQERSTLDSAKLWLEQRKQKTGAVASFAPHTPPAQRSLSTFSSPGSILGKVEDVVIVELSTRYLKAGFEGESGPQCSISFGPNSCRRVGDHRIWIPGHKRRREGLDAWGKDYELWRNDLEGVDLGLVSDVLERTVREAYNNHLLVDACVERLTLVLPSLVPHPVIEAMLSTLFKRWRYPSITLLPSPTMTIIAAGLRSGLVIDIGWEETVITAIYEYREISAYRSTRATKMLTQRFATMLKTTDTVQSARTRVRFDLDLIEELLVRAMATIGHNAQQGGNECHDAQSQPDESIDIEWPSGSVPYSRRISKQDLMSLLLETLSNLTNDDHPDDHEVPLPQLIYKALVSLSPDSRGVCMSRIIFTGHLSFPQTVRSHILKSTESIIHKSHWTTVSGKHVTTSRSGLSEIAQVRTEPADMKHNVHVPTTKDYVEEKVQKQKAKAAQNNVQGELREVHSLGPWAGASLLVTHRVRGFVEIERDRFLSHGLAGASRDMDVSMTAQPRVGVNAPIPGKSADRNSWTLGGWG